LTFADFSAISRFNIQKGSLPTALLGVVLAAPMVSSLFSLAVALYVLLFFTILTFACNLNAYSDVEVDRRYKTYMSDAVERIGRDTVRRIMAGEVALSLVLAGVLAYLGHVPTTMLALFGLILAAAYSQEPFRWKRRGLLGMVPVAIGLYLLPIPAGWLLIRPDLPTSVIVVAVGYALVMEGITLVNTCEDYAEDAEEDINTPAHVLGLHTTLLLAPLMVAAGAVLSIWAVEIQGTTWLARVLLGVFGLASVVTVAETWPLHQEDDLEAAAKGAAPNMPRWFIMTRFTLLAAVIARLI